MHKSLSTCISIDVCASCSTSSCYRSWTIMHSQMHKHKLQTYKYNIHTRNYIVFSFLWNKKRKMFSNKPANSSFFFLVCVCPFYLRVGASLPMCIVSVFSFYIHKVRRPLFLNIVNVDKVTSKRRANKRKKNCWQRTM